MPQTADRDEPPSDRITEPDVERIERKTHVRARSVPLAGLFILACFYSLYFAREFFLPVTLAIMFSFLLSPVVRLFHKIRVPQFLAAIIVIVGSLGIIGAVVYELSGPLMDWAARAPAIVSKLRTEVQAFKKPVEKVNEISQQVQQITNAPPGKQTRRTTEVEVKRPSLGDALFTRTRDVIFGLVVFLVLLYFLLSSGDLFLRKLIHVLPRFEDKKRAVLIAREIEDHISKYLLTVACINACLGAAGGLVFYALGIPNPALWGAIGFVLNFIPYLGAITTICIVAMVSLATFPTVSHAILPPLCYLALATMEGNFVTPYIMGQRMLLNPVVIFLGVTFWGWLWGILGILLAVPLLVSLKILCDHIEPLAAVGEFLGG